MKIDNFIKKLVKEEFVRQERLIVLKERKEKVEKILKEFEDFEGDIPEEWQDFDEFEFNNSAKDAAMSDINADEESGGFTDIGDNDFEKGMDSQSFVEPIKIANLKLPNQEKEVDDLQKKLDFEKKFGTMNVNENK